MVPAVSLNNKNTPKLSIPRYLGLILDQRLTWVDHKKKKRILLNSRRKFHYYLIDKHSNLSMKTEILRYKILLMPIWTYGIQQILRI